MRILHLLTTPHYRLNLTSYAPIVFGYIGFTLFALFLGARGLPDMTTLHNYVKFLLGILLMFAVLDGVQDDVDVQWALRLLLIGGAVSACIGLVLYVIPATLSEQLLVQFGRFGYPTSGRILRYVEDDTSGLMRAIGLSVDPNSYGGMLAVIGAIAATQTIVAQPVLPRKWMIPISAIVVLVLFLTFSRAALGGLMIAAIYVATVRYRRLWGWIVAAGIFATILIVFVGIGEQFVTRIVQGVQFQDRANQMRLAEFDNAIAVIQAYPFFGIGFGTAPDIDLVAGVSNIYLAIAQRLGLIGLVIFVGMMLNLFVRSWQSLQQAIALQDEVHASWLIGLQAGIVAALAVGMLDHYFFNIEFSHMTALLWCTIGLQLAVARNIATSDGSVVRP
jgi:O-antigen ligase